MKKILVLIILLINLTAFGQKQNNKPNIIDKSTLEFQEQNLINFEKLIIDNKMPRGDGIETKYDDKQYLLIVWKGGSNNNIFNYSVENMALIGYEYIKVSISDSRHKVYVYRNCSKNLVFEVTEWFSEKKVSLSLQWYDGSIKNQIGYLMYCDLFGNNTKEIINKKISEDENTSSNNELANYENKKIVSYPLIPDNPNKVTGRVFVMIQCDSKGNVITSSIEERLTKVTDKELLENCKKAALRAKMNANEISSNIRKCIIVFNFK